MALVRIVLDTGNAPWATTPLSYLGLFPYSEGSAVIILISGFQATSGMPLDLVVILSTDLIVLVGAIGTFLCIMRVTRSAAAANVGAFAFVTSPILLFYSDQTVTTRLYAVSWIPLLILLLIDGEKWGRKRLLIVAGPVLLLLICTHLSFILIILILLGILVLKRIDATWRQMRSVVVSHRPLRELARHHYLAFLGTCGLLVVTVTIVAQLAGAERIGLQTYELGILPGSSAFVSFINLIVSTVGGAGLASSVFVLLAPRLWGLTYRSRALPILAAILLASGLVGFRLYVRPVVATLLAIGAGLGVLGLQRGFRHVRQRSLRSVAAVAIIGFLLISMAASVTVERGWSTSEFYVVTQSSYSAFTYIRYKATGNLFCNQYPSDRFLTAYSGKFCNPSLPGSGLEMVPFIAGTMNWSDLNLRPSDLFAIITGEAPPVLYNVVGYNPYSAYYQVAQNPIGPPNPITIRYGVHFVIEDRQYAGHYAIRWTLDNPLPSPLLQTVRDTSYIIFQDSTYNLWYI